MSLNLMEQLSDDIGVRVGGTEAAQDAADLLAETFTDIGMEPTRQSFRFEGYEITDEWELDVLSHDVELDIAPVLYSESTPPGGIEGRLVDAGTIYLVEELFELPQYAIVDGNETVGYLIANTDGEAFPIPSTDPQFVETYGLISEEGNEWVRDHIDDEEIRVNLTAGGERIPGYTGQNVIAQIEGTDRPDEEVIIGAHYDSAYQSPGAADNAAGVEAMMRVADHYAANPPERTLTFIAYGCEEWWLLGSRHYVKRRKQEGTLDKIQAAINIDTLGRGETTHVWAGDGDIKAIAGHAVEHVVDEDTPRNYQKAISGSDHWPFYEEDIPVAMLINWPYDDYHLPSDTSEKVNIDQIHEAADITIELIDTLDASPEYGAAH